ncbi:MAG: hypothetical protein ACYSWQ_00745 [Planctomycetota bacterium]|jgi:hypothetical protein
MSKQLISLAILVLALSMGGEATASTYTDAGPTHLFNDPCNWTEGVPYRGAPGGQQWANMTVDDTILFIEHGMDVSATGLYVGCYGGDNEFYMTGGNLKTNYLNVGRGEPDSGSVGYFKMTGGIIQAEQEFKIPNQFDGKPGMIVGHADLHGGEIWLTGESFVLGDRTSGVYEGGIGTVDLAGTKLLIKGDKTAIIQDYIDKGWITAYGDAGEFELDYGVRSGGATTLTAKPIRELPSYPTPKNGAIDVGITPVLGWTPGDSASQHDVYLGTDEDAVANADQSSPEYMGRQNPTSYPAAGTLDLELGTTYYWRIDEVNPSLPPGLFKSKVWSFMTANYVVADSFESYDGTPLSGKWTAGGSAVHAIETAQTHGGRQAMSIGYNDTASAAVTRAIADQDWTRKGIEALYIWCMADPNAGELSVKLNDAGAEQVAPNIGQKSGWQELRFDLSRFGVDLGNVSSIAVSITAATGRTGIVYIDDIRLYPCIPGLLESDFNGDCVVDFKDFAIMADSWYETAIWP